MLDGDVRDCRIGMTLGYQTHAFPSAQQTPSSILPSVYGFDDSTWIFTRDTHTNGTYGRIYFRVLDWSGVDWIGCMVYRLRF